LTVLCSAARTTSKLHLGPVDMVVYLVRSSRVFQSTILRRSELRNSSRNGSRSTAKRQQQRGGQKWTCRGCWSLCCRSAVGPCACKTGHVMSHAVYTIPPGGMHRRPTLFDRSSGRLQVYNDIERRVETS